MTQPKFTPCLNPDCDEYAVNHGRCARHYVPFRGSTRKERLPKDWKARRNAVMARDQGRCHVCGGTGADAVDHVIAGDNHGLENLAPIHQDIPPYCHRYKTAAEGHAAQYGRPF